MRNDRIAEGKIRECRRGNDRLTRIGYRGAMIRGAIIAVIVLAAGDLCFNRGQIVHEVAGRVAGFGAASSEAVQTSIFRR